VYFVIVSDGGGPKRRGARVTYPTPPITRMRSAKPKLHIFKKFRSTAHTCACHKANDVATMLSVRSESGLSVLCTTLSGVVTKSYCVLAYPLQECCYNVRSTPAWDIGVYGAGCRKSTCVS